MTHHRMVDDMICCCGWEDSPQAFRWSRELPAVGFIGRHRTRPVKNMTSVSSDSSPARKKGASAAPQSCSKAAT